jgi:exonuclease SbcC
MIPITLKLAGFLSYAEPVVIDFTGFDLACISGQNGAGKSSLLDAITWALFGIARKRDDSIINSRKKTAEVSFQFEYEGNIYRIDRSRTAGKTALLEFFIYSNEGWHVLSEPTMSKTEEMIRKTLRLDYETFTNASFFLQGKADQFAQQTPTERKNILSNILGLEIWEEYRERAAEQRKALENELSAETARLEEIRAELDQEDARRKRLQDLEIELQVAAKQSQEKNLLISSLRKQSAVLDEQKKLVDILVGQKQQKEALLAQLKDKVTTLDQEVQHYQELFQKEVEIRTAYERWQQIAAELKEMDALSVNFNEQYRQRAEPQLIIEKEKSRLEQQYLQLSEGEKQVKTLLDILPVLQDELKRNQEEKSRLEKRLATRTELESSLQELNKTQADLKAENNRLRSDMDELHERINHLSASTGAECPLCGQSLEKEDRLKLIASLEKQGKEKGDRHRDNAKTLKNVLEEQQRVIQLLAELEEVQKQLRDTLRQIDQLSDRILQAEKTINEWQKHGEPELRKITENLEKGFFAQEARANLEIIDAKLKDLGYDPVYHEALRKQEEEERKAADELHELEKARAAFEPLQRQMKDTRSQVETTEKEFTEISLKSQQAIERYEEEKSGLPDIATQEREFYDLKERENTLRMQVGGAQQAVDVLKGQQERKKEIEARLSELREQITRYRTLERSCGKDGVPALLIEQALPELETQANDILDRLTAGSMSVRFVTQTDYKSKKRDDKKETLDIMIHDPAGTRAYELFSGGEAFRVNFAIRLALARVLAQRAGARLQTLVIDEGFGSQDTEGKQRLIEAINLVQHDFKKILVITHLEELKDAFPARIEVEKSGTGSIVRVIT